MSVNNEKKAVMPRAFLVLATVFLTNPTVNIFDYLPDVIGYLIIACALSYLRYRAPFFEEARRAFLWLGAVSAAKIPSYIIMVYVRGQNVGDNDIKSLFTFVFTVIETVLLINALKNLFDALSYLGQRSDAASLISPFPLSKDGRKSYTPERLQIMLYAFVICKAALTALPEMLLLTRGVESSNYHKVFNVAKLYPYVIIAAVVTVLVWGIIVTRRVSKYLSAIYAEGRMLSAADSLIGDERREELSKRLTVRYIKTTLSLFIAASACAVDIRFDNLEQINLLPDIIFGILIIIAIARLSKQIKGTRCAVISGIVFCVAYAAEYVLEILFLTRHGYGSLVLSKLAKADYIPVMVSGGIAFLSLAVLMAACAKLLNRYIEQYTGIDSHSKGYSRTDAEYHRTMKRRAAVWCGLGIFCFLTKLCNTVFRYFSSATHVATDVGLGTVTTGLVPWFGIVVTLSCIAFFGYGVYFFNGLKEDTELKLI